MVEDQLLWAASQNLVDRVRLLLVHGVAVDGRGTRHPWFSGATAYAIAVRSGNAEIAGLLRAAGAAPVVLDPAEELVAACLRSDGAAVELLLAADRDLGARAAAAEPDAVIRAARLGRPEAVRLLVGLGFDVNVVRRTTALHEAAAGDHLPMVELLLELGADLGAVDQEFGATPLGWALHNGCDAVAAYLRERTL